MPPTQSPPTLPSNFCFVGEGGWYRAALQLEFIGEQNELLKAAANSIPTDLFNVALSPCKRPIHLRITGQVVTSYTQLTYLNLDTWWSLYDKGTKLYPAFFNLNTATCTQRSLRWTPPEDMGLFYVSQYTANQWTHAFLVAVKKGVDRYYRLPTGNVNGAGCICMGKQFKSNNTLPLLDQIQAELESFLKTTWNNDLLVTDQKHHTSLFSFLADGSAQVPIQPGWEKLCQVMNATAYNGIPFQSVLR